jgi:hypothetical protein
MSVKKEMFVKFLIQNPLDYKKSRQERRLFGRKSRR